MDSLLSNHSAMVPGSTCMSAIKLLSPLTPLQAAPKVLSPLQQRQALTTEADSRSGDCLPHTIKIKDFQVSGCKVTSTEKVELVIATRDRKPYENLHNDNIYLFIATFLGDYQFYFFRI